MIKIERDKWKHFVVGLAMGMTFQVLAGYFIPEHFVIGIITSLGLIIAISYGFELFSLITGKGHYEILDALAAIIGGILGIAIILLIKNTF